MEWVLVGVAFVAVAALALVVLAVLRMQPEIDDAVRRLAPQAMREAPARASVPALSGVLSSGEHAVLSFTDDALLAFLDGSPSCASLWRDLDAVAQLDGVVDRVVIVTRDGETRDVDPPVTVMTSDDAFDAYAVPGAPYFVHLNAGRVAGEGSAPSWGQVARMAREAQADERLARVSRRRVLSLDFGERLARADRALRDAGIEPGHPSLRPDEVGTP